MAKGTTFGSYRSDTDLYLIQNSFVLGPAVPRINLVDVPGSNGSKDLTEALGRVSYQDRELEWTFTVNPKNTWSFVRQRAERLLNGKRMDIILDEDSSWIYNGRISFDSYETDSILHRIKIKAICNPYRLSTTESSQSVELSDTQGWVTPNYGAMPLQPVLTVSDGGSCTLHWSGQGGHDYSLSAGTFTFPYLVSGSTTFGVKGSGTLTITWTGGTL